jgi:hypothetical protein
MVMVMVMSDSKAKPDKTKADCGRTHLFFSAEIVIR